VSAVSTFERYAARLESRRMVESGALTATEHVKLIRRMDSAVEGVAGRGFEPTPFSPAPELAVAAGVELSLIPL